MTPRSTERLWLISSHAYSQEHELGWLNGGVGVRCLQCSGYNTAWTRESLALESEVLRKALIMRDPKFLKCLSDGDIQAYFTEVSVEVLTKVSNLVEHSKLPGHSIEPISNVVGEGWWYYCPKCKFREKWDIQSLEAPPRVLNLLNKGIPFEELLGLVLEFRVFLRIPSRFERMV